jgi:glycosidase
MLCLALAAGLPACATGPQPLPEAGDDRQHPLDQDIIYHVFLRSFYDSDGDLHGDLEGLRQKLDYLADLGVTAILLTPLYESDLYHNYFPNDFEQIDPEYGTLEAYQGLVEEIHRRGMKLFMDMEIQYVTEKHPWYRDAYGNPESPYSDFILFNGPNNTDPESGIFFITDLPGYDGNVIRIASANMKSPELQAYHTGVFKYWMDPNGDGNFDDGVDGYRIDHIMDDLDWKGILTNLLSEFWRPLFDELRAVNPDIVIIGEQADWGYGGDYFTKADLDAVFAFPPRFAILTFDKEEIQHKADSMAMFTPPGKHAITFVENHDTDRLASEVGGDTGKMRAAAALNILMRGVPLIYYGQELGMEGTKGEWGHDGNDIPRREAFEWTAEVNTPGMALWYKDSGPWWDQTSLEDRDGISVEEERADDASLWHHYRELIALRRAEPALMQGDQVFLETDLPGVIAFERSYRDRRVIVAVNLSDAPVPVALAVDGETVAFDLEPYGYETMAL